MKKWIIFTTIIICLTAGLHAQSGQWVWVKGDSTTAITGHYGVKGVPSPLNEPPGRYACSHWTDTSGNFWITGGGHNDVWMFDPSTTEWTWMGGDSILKDENVAAPVGVYSAQNTPGNNISTGMCTWVTPDNHFWIMSTAEIHIGQPDNLWQYNPAINQWAWMGVCGPLNYGTRGVGNATTLPGARTETSTAWIDTSGNLWLFGGLQEGGNLNDMWEYNVSTGIWTWMSGTNAENSPGVYGTLGLPSMFNSPPGRCTNVAWTDVNGNFWLSGGDQSGYNIYYQDVWQFNPLTLEWTWMSGTAGYDTAGPAGINCDTSMGNNEGRRYENRAMWKICDDMIINYSGSPVGIYTASVNDLWAYVPSINEWLKMSSDVANGLYGQKGYASPSNYPPARVGPVGSVDRHHNLWMFGGATVRGQQYGDLWAYIPDSACLQLATCLSSNPVPPLLAFATAINSACGDSAGGSAQVTVTLGKPPYHYLWLPTNDTTSTAQNLASGTYQVIITDAYGDSSLQSVTVSSVGTPVVTVAPADTIICSSDSVQLCATTGFVSYAWNNGSTTSCITTPYAGNYYVTVSDQNNCTAESNHVNVATFPTSSISLSISGDTLSVYNVASCQWYFNDTALNGDTSLVLIAQQSGTYSVTIKDSNGCYTTSNQQKVMVSGISNLSIDDEVTVYPNPAQSGGWHLVVSDRILGSLVEIFDSEGRIVYKNIITQSITQLQPAVAGGIYLLRINTDSGTVIRKLVKL